MKAFDLDPKLRWLFCMTHPDDEISICAWIKELTDNGNEVFLSWTHDNAIREDEARKVARLLGVPEDRICFHGARDGRVFTQLLELIPQFQQMVSEINPDRIACGAFEQGHLDHDATNLMVNRSFSGPVLEIPFYHTYLNRHPRINRFAQSDGEEIRKLDKTQQRFKTKIARQYPSQSIWRNLLLDEARRMVTRPRSEQLRKSERMRLQTHLDFLQPHLPPVLAERVRKCPKWKQWEAAVQAIL